MLDAIKLIAMLFLLFGGGFVLMNWLTGWQVLQTRYACTSGGTSSQISQGSFRWVTLRLRWSSLIAAVELYPRFLWLRPSFPLNLFLHTVCIPWSAMKASKKTGLFFSTTVLEVQGYQWRIRIRGRPGREIAKKILNAHEVSSV